MKDMNKIDFAKGYKTLAGVILLFAPVLNERFGTNITPELLESLGGGFGTLIASFFIVYGITMKIARK